MTTKAEASRLARGLATATAAIALYEKSKTWYEHAHNTLSHTVSLASDDDIYADVHAWVLDRLPSRKQRSLAVRSARQYSTSLSPVDDFDDSPHRRTGALRVFYDGSRTQTLQISGHAVRVTVQETTPAATSPGEAHWFPKRERIVFNARDEEGRKAVLSFLLDIAQQRHASSRGRLNVAMRWGDWRQSDLPPRSLDTVILRAGQREHILADLTEFLGAERLYTRIGLPWHRGYMLHGPAGTGKTSTAKALAEHFEMDVYYIPLSDLDADVNLMRLLQQIEQRSVLVLEDIDVLHAAKSRDDAEAKGLSLSGLLNALDGLVTPHGLITIMTTNKLRALDPALIRPGRADLVEELGYLDDDQAFRLAALVLGREPKRPLPKVPPRLTHAALIEPAKAHLDDPEAAEQAMRRLLKRAAARPSHS